MTDINRRTILKGALASSAGLVGIGGAAALPGKSPEGEDNGGGNGRGGGSDEDGESGPGRGNSDQQNECTPPNELLAKFEWDEDDGEFQFEKPGDNLFVNSEDEEEQIVKITHVETDDDGEPIGFCWTSAVPVCFVSVKAGQEFETFQGDVYSGCVDMKEDTDIKYAISNVIFCVRPAQAVLCDVAMDGFGAEMHLDGDPAREENDGVVHVTSNGNPTDDYASGTVNVAYRQPGLRLGDFGDKSGLDLVYDYLTKITGMKYNALPDEVFLILQTSGQRSEPSIPSDGSIPDDGPDKFDVAYRVSNQDIPESDVGSWLTRDVDNEINGDLPLDVVSERKWKTLTMETSGNDDPTDSDYGILTAAGIIQAAGALRDSAPESANLHSVYSSDTRILGVGFGYGFTKEDVLLDAYFDKLNVLGQTYNFPLAVPLHVSSASTNSESTTVTMGLDEMELSVNDLVKSTIRLTDYLQVAPSPPSNEQGVTAIADEEDVSIDEANDEITVTFDIGNADSKDWLVSGDFDVDRDQIVSFLAEVKSTDFGGS